MHRGCASPVNFSVISGASKTGPFESAVRLKDPARPVPGAVSVREIWPYKGFRVSPQEANLFCGAAVAKLKPMMRLSSDKPNHLRLAGHLAVGGASS